MRILAFDQATKITGYCILDDGDIFNYGIIDLHKESTDIRFEHMANAILSVIYKYKPNIVIFEGVELIRNVQGMISLAQMVGVIRGYCIQNNIKYKVYMPTEWRCLLQYKQGKSVKRPELKQQSINFAKKITEKILAEDVAEAIAIAHAAYIDLNNNDIKEK